ncbi:hypothetical protein ACFL96_07140 [Thermoproteota archaeon]
MGRCLERSIMGVVVCIDAGSLSEQRISEIGKIMTNHNGKRFKSGDDIWSFGIKNALHAAKEAMKLVLGKDGEHNLPVIMVDTNIKNAVLLSQIPKKGAIVVSEPVHRLSTDIGFKFRPFDNVQVKLFRLIEEN